MHFRTRRSSGRDCDLNLFDVWISMYIGSSVDYFDDVAVIHQDLVTCVDVNHSQERKPGRALSWSKVTFRFQLLTAGSPQAPP